MSTEIANFGKSKIKPTNTAALIPKKILHKLIKKDFFNSKTHNYIDIISANLLDTIKKINKGII